MHPSCTGALLSNTSMGSWCSSVYWPSSVLSSLAYQFTSSSHHWLLVVVFTLHFHGAEIQPSCYPTHLYIHLWLAFVSLTPDLNHLNYLLHGRSKCCIQICHALDQQRSQSVSGMSIYFCWDDRGQDCGPGPFHPTPGGTAVLEETSLCYLDWNICSVLKTKRKCTTSGVEV